MTDEEMDAREQRYIDGKRRVYLELLKTCLAELGIQDDTAEVSLGD